MGQASLHSDPDTEFVLTLQDVHRRFASVTALDGASIRVRAGTVHALLGENGAGKTTLMRVAYGLTHPDAGSIHVHGRRVRIGTPLDAISLGIGMVHQHFTLVPVMTIAENVALGARGRLDITEVERRVRSISERTGFELEPSTRVESLSVGAQQRVEIIKALVRDARILILDEPTAVLAPEEADALLQWLRSYADAGNAVVLITHKLREALRVADDVTVLRRGRTVFSQNAASATAEALTSAMIGTDARMADSVPRAVRHVGTDAPVVFRVEHLDVCDSAGIVRVRGASFEVRAGEIIGIAGVEGSGQHELIRALAGRIRPAAGTLSRPRVVGFIPEDRHLEAVLLDRSLSENIALRGAATRRGLIDWVKVRSDTDALMTAFDVRAPSPDALLRTLSGGNQQKLVVARELATEGDTRPKAIVAENPARGLDVHATAEIHARLRQASAQGAAVIVYSNDIDEVLSIATRVLVAHAGHLTEVTLDRDAIGRAMVGAA